LSNDLLPPEGYIQSAATNDSAYKYELNGDSRRKTQKKTT
jgi:hypothetical protein